MNDAPTQSQSQSPSPDNAETPPPATKKKSRFWQVFWLTFLVVSLAAAWYSYYVPANTITWADNFTAARQQAEKSGKPIILYFSGDWCVPCRVMKRQVWADEEVTKAVNAGFIPVTINVDNPDAADVVARYKIAGTPVTIVTDPQGNALQWRAGGIGKAEFLDLLKTSTAN